MDTEDIEGSVKSNESNECFICFEELKNDPARPIQYFGIERACQCNACLHARCYVTWLHSNSSCPVCRKPIHLPRPQPIGVSPTQDYVIDRLPNYFNTITVSRHGRCTSFPYESVVCILISLSLIIVFSVFFTFF